MKLVTFTRQGHGDRISWQCGDKSGSVTSPEQLKWSLLGHFGAPLRFREEPQMPTPFAPQDFIVEADGSQS